MTLEDFQIPLRAKVQGTQNLHRTFGQGSSSHLDFFILLSSATGLVGTSGQANYGAGNAFQDAFANSNNNNNNAGSHTRYMSLSIGMIDGAEINNNPAVERNLQRQGLLPIKPDELVAVLDHAINPERDHDPALPAKNNSHAIVGFDGASLSRVDLPNANSQTALFSHVRRTFVEKKNPPEEDEQIGSSSTITTKPFKERVLEIHTQSALRGLITTTIARKISSLVAGFHHDHHYQEEGIHSINTTAPLSDLGLDSLTGLELASWLAREFAVGVSAAEVLEMRGIAGLVLVVIQRSGFVSEELRNGDGGG